jgi:alanine-glyoxylate transaminase / serine-glyoxylate transaminase / serine-pyruvate transaminase
VKAVAVVHAETSTGVLTPLPEISRVVHAAGALFVVDAVTSLGGAELRVDEWDIDVCYSGTQKCVGSPPGLAPITMGERALAAMDARKSKVQSFYLDLTMLRKYWQQRAYHHTAPISMIYSLREALRITLEEGLDARWQRHAMSAGALYAGLEAMGLAIVAAKNYRVPSVTGVFAPDGVDEAAIRKYLLQHDNLEVSGGLGPLAGKIFRVGLMGYNSTPTNVLTFLSALEGALADQGYEVPAGAGVAAAQQSLRGVPVAH